MVRFGSPGFSTARDDTADENVDEPDGRLAWDRDLPLILARRVLRDTAPRIAVGDIIYGQLLAEPSVFPEGSEQTPGAAQAGMRGSYEARSRRPRVCTS